MNLIPWLKNRLGHRQPESDQKIIDEQVYYAWRVEYLKAQDPIETPEVWKLLLKSGPISRYQWQCWSCGNYLHPGFLDCICPICGRVNTREDPDTRNRDYFFCGLDN